MAVEKLADKTKFVATKILATLAPYHCIAKTHLPFF